MCYEILFKFFVSNDIGFSVCVFFIVRIFFIINYFVLYRLEMLYVWRFNILELLGFFVDILRRWDYELYREGKFVYFFMFFFKVCCFCLE